MKALATQRLATGSYARSNDCEVARYTMVSTMDDVVCLLFFCKGASALLLPWAMQKMNFLFWAIEYI